MGYGNGAEHGLGVGGSIGRSARVRPLLRVEVRNFRTNQGGTAKYLLSPLLCKGDFYVVFDKKCKIKNVKCKIKGLPAAMI